MAHVDTSLGRIAYDSRGDGPPLVLLHANPGDRRDFDAIVPALAERHRVIALDWPGYGGSPAPLCPADASAMFFADVLREVTEALALAPAIVLGNSVGGYAALRLAIDRPEAVRALVLVDTGGFTPQGLVSRAFCSIKGTEAVTRAIAGRFAAHYLKLRTDVTRAMIARADAGRRDAACVAVDAAVWRSFRDPDHDLRERARAVHQPTLLAWGRHDPVLRLDVDAKEAKAAMPHAELAVFDTGHAPFAEAPEAFLAVVQGFLSRLAHRAEAA